MFVLSFKFQNHKGKTLLYPLLIFLDCMIISFRTIPSTCWAGVPNGQVNVEFGQVDFHLTWSDGQIEYFEENKGS